MKARKTLFQMLAVALSLAALLAPSGAQASTPGNHVMYIDGTSTITGYCQYVWKTPIVRDELGIPQPSTLPPTCKTDNPATPVNERACVLKRNLGPYPANPSDTVGNVTRGEVGLNPPCAGQISATTDPLTGCVDVTNGDLTCRIVAPTWFYGFCGQTYGGAVGGSLRINNGQTWTIDKMGFARGRGAWEFSGKLSHSSGGTGKVRFYFGALPDGTRDADSPLACDVTGSLDVITFNGLIVVGDLPAKVIRTRPGWHFCADDPIIGAGGTEGC